MFIFLSKFLPLFIYPLGLGVLFLLVVIFIKNRRTARWLTIFALLILWVFSTAPISHAISRTLEWKHSAPAEIPEADVIIVLGGGTEPAVAPRIFAEVNSAGDRVIAGAQLYKAGKAPFILLSGGNITWMSSAASTPADQMAELLSLMEIPSEAMILERDSQNTYENARNSREIIEEKGVEKILLVTSAMHMPRSVMLFEKQGIEVIPIPVDYTVVQAGYDNGSSLDIILGLLPGAGNLSVTTNAIKEYIGILVYALRGWL